MFSADGKQLVFASQPPRKSSRRNQRFHRRLGGVGLFGERLLAPPLQPDFLPRSFFDRPTQSVARELLGGRLIRKLAGTLLVGAIVETEAYIGERDLACHARVGKTPRTRIMYGPPGLAYVYFTYGMHWMLNLVTEAEGFPAAVLIRAIQPLEGISCMEDRRGGKPLSQLANGPAKLTQALGIAREENGLDCCPARLTAHPGPGGGGAPILGGGHAPASAWARPPSPGCPSRGALRSRETDLFRSEMAPAGFGGFPWGYPHAYMPTPHSRLDSPATAGVRYEFSGAPALPCGSFDQKRPIANEDEPPMDTNEHKLRLN